jgi:Skp family chaperone for outer membrane proteins
MKVFIAAIIAALALASAFPAAAQSNLSSGPGASVRLAAAHDSTADRETYTQKARDDMQEWQKKLHVFDEKIRAKATQAHNSAGDDLNKAWTRAEAASGRLETVRTPANLTAPISG